MRKSTSLFVTAVVSWLLRGSGPIGAQEIAVAGFKVESAGPSRVEPPRLSPAWGTTTMSVRTLNGLGFQVADSSTTFTYDSLTLHRYRTGGSPWFDFPLADLPAGALLTGLELEGCDSSSTAQVQVSLSRRSSPTGGLSAIGNFGTGVSETPGCAFFGDPTNLVSTNQTVDNRNFAYSVRVTLSAPDNTTSLGAVRVYYKLQVSSAPATATFNDVGTGHPFFRFVEALAASGITAGCGSGNYCPDAPITRGQMAVFLSTALGLHWPY